MAYNVAAANARGDSENRSTSKERVSAWGMWKQFILAIDYRGEEFLALWLHWNVGSH